LEPSGQLHAPASFCREESKISIEYEAGGAGSRFARFEEEKIPCPA